MPSEMFFSGLKIINDTAVIEFEFEGKILYLSCVGNSTETSINIKSDGQRYENIYNRWLRKKIDVRQEITDTGTIKYEANFIDRDIVCELIGELPEDEFILILENINRIE